MNQKNTLADIVNAITRRPALDIRSPQGNAGLLSKESVYAFNYDKQATAKDTQVALGLPFRLRSYQSGDLFSVFAMNEPEGYLRLHIEDAMSRIGIPNKLFYLLLSEGLQIGRIGFTHEQIKLEAPSTESLEGLIKERSTTYFEHLLNKHGLRSGLSGAQPKVLVPIETSLPHIWEQRATIRTPSTIVKAAGAEFPGVCLNEYFCLSVAKKAGLTVPDFWLSDDAERLVIDRFDRTETQRPLGFEDMAVVFGVTAAKKYQGSYESIMRATAIYCQDAEATATMFERIAVSCILRDGDAHLKNFGLLYNDPSANIAPSPAYDIVCTYIYPDLDREMALKMNKTRSFPSDASLIKFAGSFGVTRTQATESIARIHAAIDAQFEEAENDDRYLIDSNNVLKKLKAVLRPDAGGRRGP